MARTKKISPAEEKRGASGGAELAGAYLRTFAAAVERFDDFGAFTSALEACLGEDGYLDGRARLPGLPDGEAPATTFAGLEEGELLMAVAGPEGELGKLQYRGRRDRKPFGPEDLHLMGALAELVSALLRQARAGERSRRVLTTLRFILDQLPLGVICFSRDREVLVSNRVADTLTGALEGDALSGLFLGKARGRLPEQARFHFEAGGRLVYAEGSGLEAGPGEEGAAIAFLLYEMSSRRDRLVAELDKQAYRARCLGLPCTAAFLQSKSKAGAVYAAVKAHVKELEIPSEAVQPLDAHTCGCVFPGKSARSVRFLLQCHLPAFASDDLLLAVVSPDATADSGAPGASLLEAAREALAPAAVALRPRLACLEAYGPVAETLALLLEEVCRFRRAKDADDLLAMIAAEAIDGAFFDLDGYGPEVLDRLREAVAAGGEGFKVFFSTCSQPGIARARHGLGAEDVIVQKPFETQALAEAIHLQFNLA